MLTFQAEEDGPAEKNKATHPMNATAPGPQQSASTQNLAGMGKKGGTAGEDGQLTVKESRSTGANCSLPILFCT